MRRYTFSTTKDALIHYKQRGHRRPKPELSLGGVISSFKVEDLSHHPDFNLDYLKLISQQGTQWHHFDTFQESNTLLFLFRYPRNIPLGVRYALEKMLHCGSRKYPVRNMVQRMMKRSFNSSDLTTTTNDYIYSGFQTKLEKDHSHLMDTHLSMMMEPLFREQDFKEVVWRYQWKGNGIDLVGELVEENQYMWQFNENKIHNVIEKELLGREGLPTEEDIKAVTFQQLKQAHRQLFTLDNLHIFTHGDLHPVHLVPSFEKLSSKYGTTSPSQEFQTSMRKEPPSIQTFRIPQLEKEIPLIISFKMPEDIPETDRFLLPILSYLLYDMPESQFMKWNTPKTPYPKLYGYQGDCFNIGITINRESLHERQLLSLEQEMREKLRDLVKNKINDLTIEKCILHLEGEYFRNDGLKILEGCIEHILEKRSLSNVLEVRKKISTVLRNYRADSTFERLIQKYLIDNEFYIRIWGQHNRNLVEGLERVKEKKMEQIYSRMTPAELEAIQNYTHPTVLQDVSILPKLSLNELELFSEGELAPPSLINGVRVYHSAIPNNIRLTVKYDITDMEEEDIRLLPVVCNVFPSMGSKSIDSQAYKGYLQMFIKSAEMKYESQKTPEGMKLYLYLVVEFTQRNAEHGFHVCNGLINEPETEALDPLSERIQKAANETYNQVSQRLIEYHGRHLASTRSPYAMIDDPFFNARSLCSLASDILKVANPRSHLESIAHQVRQITRKFSEKARMEVLLECRRECEGKYLRYVELMLSNMKNVGRRPSHISMEGFEPQPCMKYFPNYQQEYVFEAFTVPYYTEPEIVPVTYVLSSLINESISLYNEVGGSFLFKGALVSYLRGGRKKFLELEDYYKKTEDVEEAKIAIFKEFRRYTASDYFYSGVTAEQNRHFKQAIALVEREHVEACLQKCIINDIKESRSSLLALGPHLSNYEPLIKKGWEIERSIEGMSLQMESQHVRALPVSRSKYLNII